MQVISMTGGHMNKGRWERQVAPTCHPFMFNLVECPFGKFQCPPTFTLNSTRALPWLFQRTTIMVFQAESLWKYLKLDC